MKKQFLTSIGGASLAILILAVFAQVWAAAVNKASQSLQNEHLVGSWVTSVKGTSEPESITITTHKPLGPVPGTFVTSGAFADSGILVTESRVVSALPSPFGVVTHLLLRFDGQQGSFWMRTQIIETVTDDEHIFANDGVWVIVDGTGTYSTLRGTGDMEGTVDDVANLITRTYTGLVHFR